MGTGYGYWGDDEQKQDDEAGVPYYCPGLIFPYLQKLDRMDFSSYIFTSMHSKRLYTEFHIKISYNVKLP